MEVTAALFGIIIAFTAIYLSDITGNTADDAIGSLLIGSGLMVFAFFYLEKKGFVNRRSHV